MSQQTGKTIQHIAVMAGCASTFVTILFTIAICVEAQNPNLFIAVILDTNAIFYQIIGTVFLYGLGVLVDSVLAIREKIENPNAANADLLQALAHYIVNSNRCSQQSDTPKKTDEK